ncbi:MAG: gfo/Idh/MocA family oxidoreductase, partial [Gemmataceae bacterium]
DKVTAFVGNVWYGSNGFVVCPSYHGGVAFNNDGEVVKKFEGGGDHFGNFIKAVRSRKKEDLNADILEGHLSSALCHLGNVSHRLGKPEPFATGRPPFESKAANDAGTDCVAHLRENKIDVDSISYTLGRKLTIDPKSEGFVGDKEASVMLTREYRTGFVVPDKV